MPPRKRKSRPATRSRFGRTATALLSRPLDYLQAEHLRHRALCQAIEELADGDAPDRPLARAILSFLETDMARHVADEEEDFFPVLRRRIKPDDEAERIIDLLSGEHAADERLAEVIVDGLRHVLANTSERIATPLRVALVTFADRQRRHLTVENAIVLPLAGRRLSKRDLDGIAAGMAARRNIKLGGTAS